MFMYRSHSIIGRERDLAQDRRAVRYLETARHILNEVVVRLEIDSDRRCQEARLAG